VQHSEVLSRALEVFKERNRVRKDLWARHDPEDQIRMVIEKAERVRVNLADAAPDLDIALDDAIDGINYFAFVIRLLTGETPDDNG
jgi:hypothetical protein